MHTRSNVCANLITGVTINNMVEPQIFVFIFLTAFTATLVVCRAKTTTLNSYDSTTDIELPKKNYFLMNLISNYPIIYGFRAESQKHPVVIDENGFTVIPDKVFITLRLFGNNLVRGMPPNGFLRIGFTTNDGKHGDICDVQTREFNVDHVIDDNMAVVAVNLSETIRDKPYQICYGIDQRWPKNLMSHDQFHKISLFNGLRQSIQFYHVSSDDSTKIRVIGRQLVAKYRSKNENRDAFLKSKLAQIMDEVNKIHRLTDEIQEW